MSIRRTVRQRLPGTALLVPGLLVVAACNGSNSPTDPGAGLSVAQIETRSFSLVNAAREQQSAGAQLAFDEIISRAARSYSEAMRDQGFFSHYAPGGQDVRDRLRAAGVKFSKAGENLARVVRAGDPAGMAHDQFMNSLTHRTNVLNPDYQYMGVGVAKLGDEYWITQIFIRP